MRVREVVNALGLTVAAGRAGLDTPVTGGYVADPVELRDGRRRKRNIWITLQGHLNVVAVASLNDLAAVIVAEAKPVAAEALAKAEEEGVAILTTSMAGYEIAGRLWELGIR